MNKIKNIKTSRSEVFIGKDAIFDRLSGYLNSYKDIIVLVDENSLHYCLPILKDRIKSLETAKIIQIGSGEENKTLATCTNIWEKLIAYTSHRNSLLINLGGGVITDMGGFTATTYKRGIDFINMPTTLLSQIDAAIGGKVGVNFNGLKNTIGLFKEAHATFIFPGFLATLDQKQMLSGYAEAIKHALISDKDYWQKIKRQLPSNDSEWISLIITSISIKNSIVIKDPQEKKERKLLNFGHTIGHAIESYSIKNDTTPLLHGEAIAMGMICESYLSHELLGLNATELKNIVNTILNFYAGYKINLNQVNELIKLMKQDKKNDSEKINFTLLKEIGLATINHKVNVNAIIASFNYYNSLLAGKS